MTLGDLNGLDRAAAVEALRQCCGSTEWATRMAVARPFATVDAMLVTSVAIWSALGEPDWREAFAAHPRIGAGGARAIGEPSEADGWSAQEQSRVADASGAVRDRLAAKNREYEARFGYIFIACATGKTADEMLAVLERRLANEPSTEIGVAANEQRKITELRLRKLVDGTRDR